MLLTWWWAAAMTKPTKWPVCPAKTQISLGIHPVWSETSLSAWRKTSLSAWRNIGSLAILGVHKSFWWFCHEAAHITVNLFNFAISLFSWYSWGRYFHKNELSQNCNMSIIANETNMRNAKNLSPRTDIPSISIMWKSIEAKVDLH